MCAHDSVFVLFFFKQKTAYEMRISDWSSDVCSSDLRLAGRRVRVPAVLQPQALGPAALVHRSGSGGMVRRAAVARPTGGALSAALRRVAAWGLANPARRSEVRRSGQGWVSTCSTRWLPVY